MTIEVTEVDREGYLKQKLAHLDASYERLAQPIRYELACLALGVGQQRLLPPPYMPPNNVVTGPWKGPSA